MSVTLQSFAEFKCDSFQDSDVVSFVSTRRIAPADDTLVDRLSGSESTLDQAVQTFIAKPMSWAKRTTDILVSSAMLVVLLPVFAVVAVLIKITDRGQVFFTQRRVGRDGKEFDFYKFRSMVPNAEALKAKLAKQNDHGANAITFKMKRDPRITWIGRIIRKTSIDELPQLLCVLKGDMSLVGPRPPVPAEVARYSPIDRLRLSIEPGLTCFWQVGGRGEIPFEKQVELDLQYIRDSSWWLDIKLLFLTVPAVLAGRGAF
jgi:lipopolysaccharide/colanic/teichoic acid biosynthesis glycosyltransferase